MIWVSLVALTVISSIVRSIIDNLLGVKKGFTGTRIAKFISLALEGIADIFIYYLMFKAFRLIP